MPRRESGGDRGGDPDFPALMMPPNDQPSSSLYEKLRRNRAQIGRYLLSGGTAAAIEIGTNKLMLVLGIWYMTANIVSGILGTVSAFVFHKYFVFRKRERVVNHGIRYVITQGVNLLIQAGIVRVLVEQAHFDPSNAKILSIGIVVLWNFFLYKFIVYV